MDPNINTGVDAGAVEPTAADIAETNEWDSAAKELFPGLTNVNTDTTTTTTVDPGQVNDETTTTTTTIAPEETTTTTTTVAPETTTTTTVDPAETPEQKADREKAEAEAEAEANKDGEEEAPDTTARDTRMAAREAKAEIDAVAKDVREQMFKDAPTTLVDADGDPITGIDDVMKLMNPVTGEAFTAEEAGMWLLSAQQKFNQSVANMEKTITEIAEVNVDLKDQADMVTYKYGELLKADTDLRDRIWTEYEKTLVKDPDTGIIIKMPVALEPFYDTLLAPYVKLAESMENNKAEEERVAAEAARAEEERKNKERADRSDIFGRGNVDDLTDPDDKEWANAATVVFGPKK